MRILIFLTVFIIVSCNSDISHELMQIKKVLSEQERAWNEGNIDGYMSGYMQADSLRFASGGSVSYGWETTLDRYKMGYPDKATMGKLTFSNLDIEIISNDHAMVFGKWELERDIDHPWGLFTLILRKTNEGWRILHDHTSSGD